MAILSPSTMPYPRSSHAQVQMYNMDDLHRPPDAPYPLSVRWPGEQPVTGTSNNYSIHYLGQFPIAEMQCW